MRSWNLAQKFFSSSVGQGNIWAHYMVHSTITVFNSQLIHFCVYFGDTYTDLKIVTQPYASQILDATMYIKTNLERLIKLSFNWSNCFI